MFYQYITTEEELIEITETELKPYCAEKTNILALDLETYLTSLLGYLGESDDEDEPTEDELIISAVKAASKKKKRLIPRPLRLKDGTLTGQIRTLSLGLDPDHVMFLGGKQYVIDCQKIGYAAITRILKDLLESALVLGHNLKYDYQFLYAHCGIRLRRMIDTMLIDRVKCNGIERNFSLSDLYDRNLRNDWFEGIKKITVKKYKDFKKENQQDEDWSTPELKPTQIEYAADDVFFIHYVWKNQKKEIEFFCDMFETDIPSDRGIKAVMRLECSLIAVVAHAELRGVKLDIQHHAKEVIPKLEANRDLMLARIPLVRTFVVKKTKGRGENKKIWEETITEKVSITSPEQLKVALYELLNPYGISSRQTMKPKSAKEAEKENPEMKVDKCYITFRMPPDEDGTENPPEEILINTAMDTLKRFVFEEALTEQIPASVVKIVEDVIAAKQSISLLSKFGKKMIECCTDRGYIHCNFNQLGTKSGRMSANNPNLQQIIGKGELKDEAKTSLASLFRASICAALGWKLVCADYAQVQARLAALYGKSAYLLNKFNNEEKFDIHADVAMQIMKLDYVPAKDSKERKDIGKTFGFSALFGAYDKKIKTWMRDKTDGRINLTLQEAKEMRENFFASYPEFEQIRTDYRTLVEQKVINADNNIAPFRYDYSKFRANPLHVARSMGDNYIRPRLFAMKREWNSLPKYVFNRFYKPSDDERSDNKIPYGNYCKRLVDECVGEGFNHEIQGAEANLMKVAALNIHYAFIKAGLPDDEGIVIFNHDEFVCHTRKENAEKALKIVEKEMVAASSAVGTTGVLIKADGKIGDNWYQCK